MEGGEVLVEDNAKVAGCGLAAAWVVRVKI